MSYTPVDVSTEPHQILMQKLFQCRVCSTGTWDEALEWLQLNHPPGTTTNWQKSTDTPCAPLTCSSDPTRTHYMFIC